jgi:hypothetical protein
MPKASAIAFIFFAVAQLLYLHVLANLKIFCAEASYRIEGNRNTAEAVACTKVIHPHLPCHRADFALSFFSLLSVLCNGFTLNSGLNKKCFRSYP